MYNHIQLLGRGMLVETESTLKVITVDGRVVVSEYEELSLLDASGTVNV